jgi:hypothetical protein
MREVMSPQPAVVATSGRRIVIEFTPTGVLGEEQMHIAVTGIPEGWGFIHQALCDLLKQAGHAWAQSQQPVIVPPQGVRH